MFLMTLKIYHHHHHHQRTRHRYTIFSGFFCCFVQILRHTKKRDQISPFNAEAHCILLKHVNIIYSKIFEYFIENFFLNIFLITSMHVSTSTLSSSFLKVTGKIHFSLFLVTISVCIILFIHYHHLSLFLSSKVFKYTALT